MLYCGAHPFFVNFILMSHKFENRFQLFFFDLAEPHAVISLEQITTAATLFYLLLLRSIFCRLHVFIGKMKYVLVLDPEDL